MKCSEKEENVLSPPSLFMIISFKSLHWQFLFHECASSSVCGQRQQVLQGRAAPRWLSRAVLGRLWQWQQQQHPCSCWREEQHLRVEWMPEQTAGAQAAVQCSKVPLPGANLSKSITHNCSLPVKVPVSQIRLRFRELKTHSLLRYLCQRITSNTNYQSLLVILDRCKIFTAAFK